MRARIHEGGPSLALRPRLQTLAGELEKCAVSFDPSIMPETAAERGLADPFDPEQAIRVAAKLLADLYRQFGNIPDRLEERPRAIEILAELRCRRSRISAVWVPQGLDSRGAAVACVADWRKNVTRWRRP
jgi:hypothetical protein